MLLYGLDNRRKLIVILKAMNIQWTTRYYECGEFSIQLPVAQYSKELAYIYRKDTDYLGVVQKVEFSYAQGEKYVQVSGYFLEKLLDDFILSRTFSSELELPSRIAIDMVTTVQDLWNEQPDLPSLTLKDVSLGESATIYESDNKYHELGKTLYEFLKPYGLAFRLKYNYIDDTVAFEVISGVKRTSEQTQNPYVTFSTKFGNIDNMSYTEDTSNYRNVFVADVLSRTGNLLQTVTYDISGGMRKRYMYTTYTGEEGKVTEADILQRLKEMSQSYLNITNFEITPIFGFYTLNEDYFLGDTCDIVVLDFNLQYTGRIIEVSEVFKDNEYTVSLEIGDKVPTLLMKARLQSK